MQSVVPLDSASEDSQAELATLIKVLQNDFKNPEDPHTLGTIAQNNETSSEHSAILEMGPQSIAGPLDLRATVKSGQTGMPEWLSENNSFTDLIRLRTCFAIFRLTQTAGPFKPSLRLEIRSSQQLDRAQLRELERQIGSALDLKRSLQTFYDKYKEDVLAEAFQRFPGLRLMRGWDTFEALTSCMLTQWSSVRGWNTVARRLRRSFGAPVRFTDGSVLFSSVTAERLAVANLEELRRCGTGFRAKYLSEAARMVYDGEVELEKIRNLPYAEAKRVVMQIPGVGTKVADCFLLYGCGMLEAAPVDVWMHRVIQRLYQNGEKTGQRRAEDFLRERFGSWAGYAQLYLYHYARMKRIL